MKTVYLNYVATEVPFVCATVAQLLQIKGLYTPLMHVTVNGREVPLLDTYNIILVNGMRITTL